MLASILQIIEQSLGSQLALAAQVCFALGVAMAAYVATAPLARVLVDLKAARLGMERDWILQCPACKRMTAASSGRCEQCGKSLDLPLIVRVRNFFGPEGEPRWLRAIRWTLTVAGTLAFALATVFVLLNTGAWLPQTILERLLVGVSLIAWAGVAWLAGRVFGIGTGGPISRLRDAVLALAGAAVLSAAATLAGAARPVSEEVLVRVSVQGQQARVGDRAVPLADAQFGFEYLQVHHELVGLRRVTPLAVVGASRIPLPMHEAEEAIADHLWAHSQRYGARGLAVRKLTQQFQAQEAGTYEIVLRGGEISARLAGAAPAPGPGATR
jgi:hypothetical protein